MSNRIDSKHGKLLAEIVVPSSSWKLQPEKQTPFKSDSEAISYILWVERIFLELS
jgi:hypothetical protein